MNKTVTIAVSELDKLIAQAGHAETFINMFGCLASGINLDGVDDDTNLDEFRVVLSRKELGYVLFELRDEVGEVTSSLQEIKRRADQVGDAQ